MFSNEDLELLNQQRAILENLIANTEENHIFKIMHAFQQGKIIFSLKLNLLEKSVGYRIQSLHEYLETLLPLSFIDFTSDEEHFEKFANTAISLQEFWLLEICVANGARLDDHAIFMQLHDLAVSYGNLKHASIFKQLTTVTMRDCCILISDKSIPHESKLYFLNKLPNYSDEDFKLYDKLFNFAGLAKSYGNADTKKSIIKKRILLNSRPMLQPSVSAFQYFIEHDPKDLVVLRLIAEEYAKINAHPTDENKDNIFHIVLKNNQLDEDTVYDILKTIFSVDSENIMSRALAEKDALGRSSLSILEEKPTYWERVTGLLHNKIIQSPIHDLSGLFDVFSNMQEDNIISRLYLTKKYKQLARTIRDREILRIAMQTAYKITLELFDFIWSKNEYYMVSINKTSLFNHILKDEVAELADDPCFIQAAQLMPLGKTYIWQGYNLENIKQYISKYNLESKFDDTVILDSALKTDDPDFTLLKYAISMSKYNKDPSGLKHICSKKYGETLLFKAVMSQQPEKVIWLIKEKGCDPSFTPGNKEGLLIQILVRMHDKHIPHHIGEKLIHACLDHVDIDTKKRLISHKTPATPTILEWIEMCRHFKLHDNHKIKKDEILDKLKKYLIAAGADKAPSNTTVAHTYNARTRKTQTLIYQNQPSHSDAPEDILKQLGYSRLKPC